MWMDRDPGAGGPVVQGFSPGGFRVDGGVSPALLLTPDRADGWTPPPLAELDLAALEPLLIPHLEFILLGTGASLVRPPRALVTVLEARGLGLETMDSRAAARAWGMLLGEGRSVAAALYPL